MRRIVPVIMLLVGICLFFWLIAVAINGRTDICFPMWHDFVPRLSTFSTVGNIEGIFKSYNDFSVDIIRYAGKSFTAFGADGDFFNSVITFFEGIFQIIGTMVRAWFLVFALLANIIGVPFEFLGLLFSMDEMFACPVGGNPYPLVPIDTPMDSLFA